jgi:hypothetical protein
MIMLFLGITGIMFGQGSTTSAMNGRILDETGQALPGATVVAVHVPSGTQYGVVTNNGGFFTILGMRPGGPYKVEVSFVGYEKASWDDVMLSLGESFVINASLTEARAQLGEVVVVGSKPPVFNSEKNGASINIRNEQIIAMPTISRSINDITRLTPQANGNQIGGGNYRQNFITVDGAQFNNAFGIGTNLPGNGTPISLDALDQISVNITPYDVRQSGFIGASVNAVTKSGDNEFRASVYAFMQNERYKGTQVGDATFARSPSSYNMQGMRLGGPIIKNKLFFFMNYEREKSEIPGPPRVASTPSTPPNYTNNIARPTVAQMDLISAYLKETYGFETGPYQGYAFESPGQKFLARIDWNIAQNHKFNVRYSLMESKEPSNPSTSFSPFSSLYTGRRTDMDAMWFQNSGYFQERNFYSLSSELNSYFGGGRFANTLRFTYSFQDEPRSTGGNKDFPFVDILLDDKVYTSFGTELFSFGNLREVTTITLSDDFSWSMGINNFTAGLQYETNKTKNGFQRFGTSFYVFNSWEDFVNGADPRVYAHTFSNTPGYAQAFPSFKFTQTSAYIQDEVVLSSRFRFIAGMRFDLPTYPEPMEEHPIIAGLTFGTKQFSTSTLPNQRIMYSPRLGFNYDIKGDRSMIFRGGTGIFTGRVPFVWIVAQAGDAGMLQTTQTFSGASVPGPFNPDPRAYYPAVQPEAGTIIPGSLTIIDPDFKMPQSWKSSLAFDVNLPWGLKATFEGIYNKDINTAFFVNYGLKDPAPLNIQGTSYPDNRLIYTYTGSVSSPNANHVNKYYHVQNGGVVTTSTTGVGTGVSMIVLENRKEGYYYSFTSKLEKAFDKGFSAMIAYTHSEARNLVDGAGDQAASAWNGNANVNGANSAELSWASYVVPDKIIASASYRIDYEKKGALNLSLFYEGGSQGRFSYVYSSNIVNDGAGSNNLIYIPKDPSEITFVNQTVNSVVWTAQQQSDAFFRYIDQDKYLSSRKGMYAERNGAMYPWRNQFDAKVMREFYIYTKGVRNTFQVSLDILNIGNLLNKNWGKAYRYNQNNILVMTNNSTVVAGGTVKPTFRLNPYNNQMISETFSDNIGYTSTFAMQLGLRYIFN